MRPIKLKMQAFGAYVEPITIDFNKELGENKLFLIHGATGAGKTTILDAISYALYGETSGKARKGEDMRSKNAPDDVLTEIEFLFELNGKIFKIYRSPAQEILKKRGIGSRSIPATAELTCDGNFIAAKEKAVTNKIKELVGFNAEQFRQVVLLPQGEFKKFLFSDSDKRQEVLNVLFDTEPYKKIEDLLSERAKNSAAELEKLKNRLETLEKQISDAGNDSLAEIEKKISVAQKNLIELKKLFDEAQINLADGKNLAEKFNKLKDITSELNCAQIRLSEAEKNFLAAQMEYKLHETEESQRKNLEKEIDELKKIKDILSDLHKKISELASEKIKLQEEQKDFDKYFSKSKRYEARMEELQAEKLKLVGADVKFVEIKNLREEARKRDDLLKEIAIKRKILEIEQEKLAIIVEKFTKAQIELNRLQIVNSAAHLATKLKPGEPCPVCGSLEHPAIIAEAIPTIAEIKFAEKNFADLEKNKSNQEKTVNTIVNRIENLETQLKDYENVPETAIVQKDFAEAEKNSKKLVDCLKNIETGEKCIKDNRSALEKANENKNLAAINVAKLESAISEKKLNIPEKYLTNPELLDADLAKTQEKFTELDAAWKKSQKNFNYADKIKSERAATFNSVKKIFEEYQGELKEKSMPDLDLLNKKAIETNENYGAARDEKAKLEVKLDTLKKFSSELEEIRKKFAEKEKIADMWRRLSDVANATGKGEAELKISFQRYYLSTMFNEVVTEANNRLKEMSGGRYFFQMKDAGKTKAKSAGLNLEIFDEYTGALRPVETLSGGESFLASLSLALGLAAVVQNNSGGIKLDTIFIDEGFGSLDAETLDDAISTIINQSGGRLVGIISHVEELKKQIPIRLEVKKTKNGSTAKFER